MSKKMSKKDIADDKLLEEFQRAQVTKKDKPELLLMHSDNEYVYGDFQLFSGEPSCDYVEALKIIILQSQGMPNAISFDDISAFSVSLYQGMFAQERVIYCRRAIPKGKKVDDDVFSGDMEAIMNVTKGTKKKSTHDNALGHYTIQSKTGNVFMVPMLHRTQ